jgi:hypothetical protein
VILGLRPGSRGSPMAVTVSGCVAVLQYPACPLVHLDAPIQSG